MKCYVKGWDQDWYDPVEVSRASSVLVEQASRIALDLGFPDLYAVCCKASNMTAPDEAIVCIGQCLKACEPKLDFDLQQAIERIEAQLAASRQQEAYTTKELATDKPYLSVQETVSLKGVSPKTVYHAIDRGLLRANQHFSLFRRIHRLTHQRLGWAAQQEDPSQPVVTTGLRMWTWRDSNPRPLECHSRRDATQITFKSSRYVKPSFRLHQCLHL